MSGGVVPVDDEVPKVDTMHMTAGEMYGMTAIASLVGHGCTLSSWAKNPVEYLVVCEKTYRHPEVSEVIANVRSGASSTCKWALTDPTRDVNPIEPTNKYMAEAAVYSKKGPLCVYTNVATVEARYHSMESDF
ncbi:hypothetical protein MAPG_10575 [Magnaporthiopsis poae ATCC 64411]|uniref:Uncharacterized protein n=1 Tax=Magnaporthiopsis poae (strain ATCC 64411 / 73-15) TaxID=644358 RepID=A0A0C4ECY6_MAGP6|nr:hypothetical protein MAPG_10575 [Magnaporthiopsis poae ATCC 64411]